MATRIYLPSSGAAAISPSPHASWDDVSALVRRKAVADTPSGTAMTTFEFLDNDTNDRDCIAYQWVLGPLAAQTIASGQTVEFQIRAQEGGVNNNMVATWVIRIIAPDGTTVRGTPVAFGRDGLEFATAGLVNRRHTATSAAVSVTAGDYMVIEVGAGGNPGIPSGGAFGAGHDYRLRVGDAAASDLAEDDTDTDDDNPWIEFPNTITFASTAQTVAIGLVTETESARTLTAKRTRAIALVTETEAARTVAAVRSVAVAQVSETEAARAVAHSKAVSVGLVTELEAARTVAADRAIGIGQVTETEAARQLAHAKAATLGLVTETETARTLTAIRTIAIGLVTETEEARALSVSAAQVVAIGLVTEQETPRALTALRTHAVARVTETESAQPLTALRVLAIGRATETETPQAIMPRRVIAVGRVVETEEARAFLALVPIAVLIGRVSETETARAVIRGYDRLERAASTTNVHDTARSTSNGHEPARALSSLMEPAAAATGLVSSPSSSTGHIEAR